MNIHFQRHSEAKKLAKPVREYMWQKFMLSEQYLGELRCFEYEESIDEKELLHILIFHPHLARNQHTSLRTYTDLKQHREVLLYEGHIDALGSVYVESRKVMSCPGRTASQRR